MALPRRRRRGDEQDRLVPRSEVGRVLPLPRNGKRCQIFSFQLSESSPAQAISGFRFRKRIIEKRVLPGFLWVPTTSCVRRSGGPIPQTPWDLSLWRRGQRPEKTEGTTALGESSPAALPPLRRSGRFPPEPYPPQRQGHGSPSCPRPHGGKSWGFGGKAPKRSVAGPMWTLTTG